MAVRIRLKRGGTRSKPIYRVVIAHGQSPQAGRTLEVVGHYQPQRDPPIFEINQEKVTAWLKRGAIPSDLVRKWLGKLSVLPALDFSQQPKRAPRSHKEAAVAAGPEPKKEEAKTA